MTKEEFDNLRISSKGKKFSGYLTLFPDSIKFFKKPSKFTERLAKEGRTISFRVNDAKLNEESVTFKHSYRDNVYAKDVKETVTVPRNFIQSVRP